MNSIKKYLIWSVLLSALIGLSGCGNSSSDVPEASNFSMTLDVDESTVAEDWKTLSSASGVGTLSASLVTQGKYGTFVVSGDTVTYTKTIDTNETDSGILEITDSVDSIEVTVTVHSLFWKQISEGSGHTAALKSDGTIWSWGLNNYGQLGDGTTTDSSVPVQEFTKSTDWIIVSAGDFHTAAIKSDGTLWSWGLNDEGQLGDGTTTNSSVPVQEDTFATDWIDVRAGIGYTEAKKPDGKKRRWGRENTAPIANEQNVTTDENVAILITLSGSDVNDDPLTYSIVTDPSNGTLGTLSGNEVTYTPDTDYVGADSFTFKVNDGTVDSAPATVSITVNAVFNSDDVLAQIGLEADNPDTVNSIVTVAQLSAILPALTNVIAVNETAYQDYIDANPDEFSNPATQLEVQAMIDAVNLANNNAPTASDFNMTLDINESTVIGDWKTLSSANDGDGDSLTAVVKNPGAYGTFVVTDASLAYLKTTETNATDTCVLEITDGIETVEITVTINSLYWKQISAGAGHTAAIKSDGTLWAWGDNADGQLGDGTTTDKLVPIQEISKSTNWTQVSSGNKHTSALKNDGTLWSWGENDDGQLGDGTTTNKSVPTQESSLSTNWAQVSAGKGFSGHTVAIKSDGTLWGWGDNGVGQLGDGTTTDKLVPTQESSLSTNWNHVSAGGFHTVALKDDNTSWAWGWNKFGQLGDGTTTDKLVPTQEISYSTDWKVVNAGYNYTVALRNVGTVWAWGLNSDGQLGDGTIVDKIEPTQESSLSTNWVHVSTGSTHTVAIKSDGTLWAWGWNKYGQLGDGTISNKLVPTQESSLSTNWAQVSAGSSHTVALKNDGRLWAWGSNIHGEIGDGTTYKNPVPVQEVSESTLWLQVSAGGDHTTAIKIDGTLWAWGLNNDGQIGDGTTIIRTVPTQVGYDTDWIQVDAGANHTAAIKIDGTLWVWGSNEYGKLGDGTTDSRLVPTQIVSLTAEWAQVSAGANHTAAIKTDGTLWAWGNNVYGQVGDGTWLGNKLVPTQEINQWEDWTQVDVGDAHTVALREDNTLWVWGRNNNGQLGTGLAPAVAQEPIKVGYTEVWIQVSAGGSNTAAIKPDGTLWVWGYNYYGQLGDGTTTTKYLPTQEISGSNKWMQVSAGGSHTVAIQTNGTLWAWGDNASGQLGDGTLTNKLEPTKVGDLTDWDLVSAGGDHTTAIKIDETLWSWGSNLNYALGDGTSWLTPSPSNDRE